MYSCAWLRFAPRWTTNGNVSTKLYYIRAETQELNHVVVTDAGANHTHAYLFTGLQFTRDVPRYDVGEVATAANDLATGGGTRSRCCGW